MIRMNDVNKYYRMGHGYRRILRDVNLTLERGDKIGVLGRNGAGKSTLIRVVSGAELPSSGHIERGMSVSWPLAFSGAFQHSLTGYDNLKFICRIYDVDYVSVLPFIQDFSELGAYLYEPAHSYSAGMRARLAFALSMVVEFDCFLIDEIVSVGDSRFTERCHQELFVKRADRAMMIVSHDAGYIRQHCNRAAVLSAGRLLHFATIDEAYDYYQAHPTE